MNRIEFFFHHIKPGKILDIGNLGRAHLIHSRLLRDYPESDIYGLDTDDQAPYGHHFPNQYRGNAEDMPFSNEYFDTIILGEVLEHTWTPKRMIDECFRVLKPTGVFLLSTPNIYALSRMVRYFFVGKDVILGGPEHKIFFSRAMLDNILKKAGFREVLTLSDSKCTVKRNDFALPSWGTFRFMGEHLVAKAIK